MKWVKKDDNVMVIAGNDRGKIGSVMYRKKDKIVVKGINVRKKNVRQKDKKASKSVYIEMPIHISNVALCDKDGKKIKKLKKKKTEKEQQLVYLSDGKEVIYRTVYNYKKKR